MITIEKNDNNETVEIFELDGKVYSVPAKPRAGVLLRYMRNARKFGEEAAASELLEAMLGEEAYDALEQSEDVTIDDFQKIMEEVQKHVMGAVEEAGKDE